MSTEALYSYRFFRDRNAPRTERAQLLKPLSISFNHEAWRAIDAQHQVRYKFEERAYNLMSGATNLINIIESNRAYGTPVETLLFMDRSGRLAAYLLTNVYRHLEEFGGPAGAEITSHKPAIRFINSGYEDRNKHGDTSALRQLSNLFRPEDLKEGSTLIVDEYIESGGSIRRTTDAIAKAGYAQNAPGISMFRDCPDWYRFNDVKGINEVEIDYTTRARLEKYADGHFDEIESATEVIRQYGWRAILAMNKPHYSKVEIPDEDRACLEHVMKGAKTRVTQTTLYLASNGGFSGLSPSKKQLKKSRWYRNKLQDVVTAAFENNLINIGTPAPTTL